MRQGSSSVGNRPSDGPGASLAGRFKLLALLAIRCYQITLSPYLGRQCRFYPTCSQYAMEAIEHHGVLRGSGLALRRLGRCQPLHPGGVDLVPAAPGRNHQEEP